MKKAEVKNAKVLKRPIIHASLYELIEAMQDPGAPGKDPWVVAAVQYLMASGRIKWSCARREFDRFHDA